MIQQLKALAALPEDLHLTPSPLTIVCISRPRESKSLFWPSRAPGMHVDTGIKAARKHIRKYELDMLCVSYACAVVECVPQVGVILSSSVTLGRGEGNC